MMARYRSTDRIPVPSKHTNTNSQRSWLQTFTDIIKYPFTFGLDYHPATYPTALVLERPAEVAVPLKDAYNRNWDRERTLRLYRHNDDGVWERLAWPSKKNFLLTCRKVTPGSKRLPGIVGRVATTPRGAWLLRPSNRMIEDAKRGELTGFFRGAHIHSAKEWGCFDESAAVIYLSEILEKKRLLHSSNQATGSENAHLEMTLSIGRHVRYYTDCLDHDAGYEAKNSKDKRLYFISAHGASLPTFHFWVDPGTRFASEKTHLEEPRLATVPSDQFQARKGLKTGAPQIQPVTRRSAPKKKVAFESLKSGNPPPNTLNTGSGFATSNITQDDQRSFAKTNVLDDTQINPLGIFESSDNEHVEITTKGTSRAGKSHTKRSKENSPDYYVFTDPGELQVDESPFSPPPPSGPQMSGALVGWKRKGKMLFDDGSELVQLEDKCKKQKTSTDDVTYSSRSSNRQQISPSSQLKRKRDDLEPDTGVEGQPRTLSFVEQHPSSSIKRRKHSNKDATYEDGSESSSHVESPVLIIPKRKAPGHPDSSYRPPEVSNYDDDELQGPVRKRRRIMSKALHNLGQPDPLVRNSESRRQRRRARHVFSKEKIRQAIEDLYYDYDTDDAKDLYNATGRWVERPSPRTTREWRARLYKRRQKQKRLPGFELDEGSQSLLTKKATVSAPKRGIGNGSTAVVIIQNVKPSKKVTSQTAAPQKTLAASTSTRVEKSPPASTPSKPATPPKPTSTLAKDLKKSSPVKKGAVSKKKNKKGKQQSKETAQKSLRRSARIQAQNK